ncbi:MAG: hypothetical protein ACP5P1_06705 [Acidimicrobiales bacterium]
MATPPTAEPSERAKPGAQIMLRQQPRPRWTYHRRGIRLLHRMTGLIDSQPFVVEELLEVLLDPPLGESTFRVDPSKVWDLDAPEREMLRPRRPAT